MPRTTVLFNQNYSFVHVRYTCWRCTNYLIVVIGIFNCWGVLTKSLTNKIIFNMERKITSPIVLVSVTARFFCFTSELFLLSWHIVEMAVAMTQLRWLYPILMNQERHRFRSTLFVERNLNIHITKQVIDRNGHSYLVQITIVVDNLLLLIILSRCVWSFVLWWKFWINIRREFCS